MFSKNQEKPASSTVDNRFSLHIILITFCLFTALWTLSYTPILVAAPTNQTISTTPVAPAQVIGQIQYPTGEPMVNLPFRIYNKNEDICPHPDRAFPHLVTYSGTSNDMGQFSANGLEVGIYCLLLPSIKGTNGFAFWPPEPRSFSIEEGEEFVDLGIISFHIPRKQVIGFVRNESGKGISNARILATLDNSIGPLRVGVQTDSMGQFTFMLGGGEWDIELSPYTEQGTLLGGLEELGQTVQFADDLTEEVATVDFSTPWPDAVITGEFRLTDGTPVPLDGNTLVIFLQSQEHLLQKDIRTPGRFTMSAFEGSYIMTTYTPPSAPFVGYLPTFEGIQVKAGEAVDLGEIRLLTNERATLQGQIMDTDGRGISDIRVSAWNGQGHRAMTRSDNEGSYLLQISEGPWQVGIGQPLSTTYFIEEAIKSVFVTEIETVNFTVLSPSGKIIGTMLDAEGNLLTDVKAWAYAIPIDLASKTIDMVTPMHYNSSSMLTQFEAIVEDGHFEFNVPDGSYKVGVSLQPQSDYLVVEKAEITVEPTQLIQQAQRRIDVANRLQFGEQIVTVNAPKETNLSTNLAEYSEVAIILQRKDAYITGILRKADGTPATGITGEVKAMTEDIGTFSQYSSIEPSTAAYTMAVLGGTWHLGYFLDDDTNYLPYSRKSLSITLGQGETAMQDLTVVELDRAIQGTLSEPDGTPVNSAYIWVNQREEGELGTYITGKHLLDGQFELNLAAGLSYELNVSTLERGNYIQPQRQLLTSTQGISSTISLQLLSTNATISGTATAIYANHLQPAANAFIYAWSDAGQYLYTKANEMGGYQIDLVAGTVWHIGASWYPGVGPMFYKLSDEVVIGLSSAGQREINLTLIANPQPLPSAKTALFKAKDAWVERLADGMQINIPAGAIPVDGVEDDVRLVITPLTEMIPATFIAHPIGYGYAIQAYKGTTGEEISSNLNEDAILTFYYTDAEIVELGITEDKIMPAYFSNEQGRWVVNSRFTIDKERNQVTMQMDRFSNWAIIVPNKHETPIANYQLFLPTIR